MYSLSPSTGNRINHGKTNKNGKMNDLTIRIVAE